MNLFAHPAMRIEKLPVKAKLAVAISATVERKDQTFVTVEGNVLT